MDDDAYYSRNNREPQHASHFPFSQQQFKQPAKPIPARDRFRSTQYDEIVDDAPYDHSAGIHFDSFGEWHFLRPRKAYSPE
jgi:hypothetical protein